MACGIDYIPSWGPTGKQEREQSWPNVETALQNGVVMLQETHLINFDAMMLTESNSLTPLQVFFLLIHVYQLFKKFPHSRPLSDNCTRSGQ